MRSKRTPISYYGGKQRIASKIVEEINKIPHSLYAEPFYGGGAVLYEKGVPTVSKQDHYIEAINDKNELLITFWRVARDSAEELERLIFLTPFSQSDYKLSREIYNNPEKYSDKQIAWAVFVQTNMSFSNKIGHGWGASRLKNQATGWMNKKYELHKCFDRLKTVAIGCEDAIDFIKRWDRVDALFYCDPPYVGTDQGHYHGYTKEDYKALCNTLDDCKASYVLSHYHQDIYPKSATRTVEIKAIMSASKIKELDKERTEILWICDRSESKNSQGKTEQLSLF
jgi:DNA adenine methylase